MIRPIASDVAVRPVARPQEEARPAAQTCPKPSGRFDELILTNSTRANQVTYHVGAEDSFRALLDLLANAKRSFHVETFIWHDDRTGRQFAEALVAKVKAARAEGKTFDAKVIIDSMGLKSGFGSKDQNIVDYLKVNGVDVKVFNPLMVNVKAEGLLPLTHRKLYIADGERYMTGGRNIGDEYLRPTFQSDWGDPETETTSYNDFLMTVVGEEASRIEGEFYKNWQNAGGKKPDRLPEPVPAVGSCTTLETFTTDPLTGGKSLQEAHLKAIANARREIFIVSPYFADDGLIDALLAAKKKNQAERAKLLKSLPKDEVDRRVPELKIKVLIPLSGEKGKDLNYQIDMESARHLLNAGIEIRATSGGTVEGKPIERFSHFKAMVVDGELLSVGSANADYRTYHTNHELVNLTTDPGKVREFEETVIGPDWDNAMPLTQDWIKDHSKWYERTFRKVFEALDFLY